MVEPDIPEANLIMSLNDEYRNLREQEKEMKESLKPLDLYLENCKRFSTQNLHKETITVSGYKFKRFDF